MYDIDSVIDYYKTKNLSFDINTGIISVKFNLTPQIVSDYYNEARKLYHINLDFYQFYNKISQNTHRFNYIRFKHDSIYYYREKRSFSKKKIKKKILSDTELFKREWKKKINREKRRPNWKYSSKSWRKLANKKERRSVKQNLNNADWDNYINFGKRYYLNPWCYS